ncbi:uncharacterized protein LOC122312582 [Carya illinoinensis]|uniref:uncharacterized protein LOC122312582 n=1 Tax=Carya illinoinensis TaxID=32201 RepID=UPI001C72454F|nr:uncharacterized protein LOC122312582 [Carya illinoinensis]
MAKNPQPKSPKYNSPSEDPNSHFFIHHSDNAHMVIVTPPLIGSNYLTWNRSFTLAISIKNKLGFLDGSVPILDISDPLYVPWLRCNNLLIEIFNSISKEIDSNVMFVSSAKDVWEKLKDRFSQPDNVWIYNLQQQLNSIVQGNLSVSEYFTQLNAIWEELNSYRPLPHCLCGKCNRNALNDIGKTQQLDNIFKFLMGLTDKYDNIREQIILTSLMPFLDKTFSLVLQKERQRKIRTVSLSSPESPALAVLQNNKSKEKSDMTCYHCGKVGHTKEKCFRLISQLNIHEPKTYQSSSQTSSIQPNPTQSAAIVTELPSSSNMANTVVLTLVVVLWYRLKVLDAAMSIKKGH